MVEAAYFIFKIPRNTSPLYAASFYKAVKLMLIDLRELYRRHSSVDHAYLQSFRAVKLQVTKGLSRSVYVLFLNNLRKFKFDPQDKRKCLEEMPVIPKRCLISCVENSLFPGNEGTKLVRDVISATKRRTQAAPQMIKGR